MKEKEPVLSEAELIYLFKAKCKDLGFPVNLKQLERFRRYIKKHSFNGKLKLINHGLSENSAKAVVEIIHINDKIKKLYLGQNKLLDFGAILLSRAFKVSTNIIHLDLSSNGITWRGFSSLFGWLQNNNTIVSLNLSSKDRSQRNKLAVKGAEKLAEFLKKSWYIQFLNISSTALCNDGCQIVLKALNHHPTLISLIIQSNEMTHAAIDDLCKVVLNSNIEYLDISHNNISNTGVSKFSPILQYSKWNLKILKLNNWGFNSSSAYHLYNAVKYNSSLVELYVDDNFLSYKDLTEIRNMIWGNNKLKILSMWGWKIGDEGAIAIAEGYIRNNAITHLLLRNNNISDEAGKEIIQGLSFPRSSNIEVLNLANNMLGDKSSEALLYMLPKLRNPPSRIYLENNLIKSHKYKMLELFAIKNFNQDAKEEYFNKQRKVKNQIFKREFVVEKASMKDDHIDFQNTKDEIERMIHRKSTTLKDIEGFKVYSEGQKFKELEETTLIK